MSATERLAALGLTLPEVATPVGSYVPALREGNLVYTSGQVPFVGGTLLAVGQVGESDAAVTPDVAVECARVCVLNAIAAIAQVSGGLESIERIVKLTGFVSSLPEFTGQPAVINGASNLLGEIFGDSGRHARSAVGVASLPLGAPVEIELIATVRAV